MDYIRVTRENIDKEHICCAMSGKQSFAKKEWLKQRFEEGLVFYRSAERGKCFIEYIPAENAWVPIDAAGWLYINCLWVSGSMKGHGYSSELLEKCLRDAKAQGKNGVCILCAEGRNYWEYVQQCEDKDIWDYLAEVWKTMREAIERGLDQEGVLPGPLNLRRKASTYYIKAKGYKDNLRSRGLVFSYALAVSEENASGGKIVTAPTCGSCGVVPAVLYHLQKSRDFSDMRILRALATAGLIGNIVKHNALFFRPVNAYRCCDPFLCT